MDSKEDWSSGELMFALETIVSLELQKTCDSFEEQPEAFRTILHNLIVLFIICLLNVSSDLHDHYSKLTDNSQVSIKKILINSSGND